MPPASTKARLLLGALLQKYPRKTTYGKAQNLTGQSTVERVQQSCLIPKLVPAPYSHRGMKHLGTLTPKHRSLVKPFQENLQTHTQECLSIVTLHPVTLAAKVRCYWRSGLLPLPLTSHHSELAISAQLPFLRHNMALTHTSAGFHLNSDVWPHKGSQGYRPSGGRP